MPGANWNVPTTFDPADPRQRFKRRDPEVAKSEVKAREARDEREQAQFASRTESEESSKSTAKSKKS